MMKLVDAHMTTLRWLLVLPSWLAGVVLSLVLAMALRALCIQLCPPELLVSGMCMATWYRAAESLSICAGAAVGAATAVLLPSLAAPQHRGRVALAALGLGTACATWWLAAGGSSLLAPFACALASGVIAVRMALSWGGKTEPGPARAS
jgi:hypothetical protein